ncbi:hypothetical protein C5P26_26495, partial [Escherichia coli]
AGAFGPPSPRKVGEAGWASPCRLSAALTTNPGARSAKEHETKKSALPFGTRRPLSRTRTTLGNGYLGSRIDEERSKMRYLV